MLVPTFPKKTIMPQNLKSSMVLRLSAFFRLLISHLTPTSVSNSPNFLGRIPLLLAPHLLLHRRFLPAITCEAPTTPWSLSDMSSVIACNSDLYVIPSQSRAMGIFLHVVGDGGKGSSDT